MKKLISMVLTAAMCASLVPATAFAADQLSATAYVVNGWTVKADDVDTNATPAGDNVIADGNVKDYAPELVIEFTSAKVQGTNNTTNVEFTVTLDNADFVDSSEAVLSGTAGTPVTVSGAVCKENGATVTGSSVTAVETDDKNEIIVTATIPMGNRFAVGDYITLDLTSVLDKVKDAYVSVESDDITISNDGEEMIYVDVAKEGITAETKKLAKVAEEEVAALERDLVIKSAVGNFIDDQVIQLKLSKGFEFRTLDDANEATDVYDVIGFNDDYAEIVVKGTTVDEITIDALDMRIEAVDAKAGTTCVLTVKAANETWNGVSYSNGGAFAATAKVEIAEVVDYAVLMSVDEDEDLPVIYSGTDLDNTGLTDDSDHWSVEVTVEETFPGAWSMRKGFDFELPEGVYVTDVDVINAENFWQGTTSTPAAEAEWEEAFWDAYQNGDHVKFEFEKRTFNDVDTVLFTDPATVTFQLQLVADPGFVGDVELTLKGDLVDEQAVTIATFATPFYVTAEQNDLKIDYRETPIYTEIVVTEAEAGLWDDGAQFLFTVERNDYIEFDGDPVFTVNEESGMELDDAEVDDNGDLVFFVDSESDEPAVVTISDMKLFLDRTIPAGAYELEIGTTMGAGYIAEVLFAPDAAGNTWAARGNDYAIAGWSVVAGEWTRPATATVAEDTYVDDVCDFSAVVHEAFVNIVTAGREQDDASFTTIVQVPVGELYLVAGETTVELDVPAYINANGYTMLPVRAVAKALGINNNNVLWDQATKTVTILYGQRIITMQVGASVIYVNGSAIPAASSVEIVDGRTFLGLRDLATALGVTTIDWDPASKTALLNAEFEA